MTVKELRGKLDAIPDDYEVFVEDWMLGVEDPAPLNEWDVFVNDSEHEVVLGLRS